MTSGVEHDLLPPHSILNPDVHFRVIENLKRYCEIAGIPEDAMHISAKKVCKNIELDWARSVISGGKGVVSPSQDEYGLGGLCLTGTQPRIMVRMQYLTGSFLRAFIDARFVTGYKLLSHIETGDYSPSVLMIPDLYTTTHGKNLTGWQLSMLHSYLVERAASGKKTFCYIEDLTKIGEMSKSLREVFDTYYRVEGGI